MVQVEGMTNAATDTTDKANKPKSTRRSRYQRDPNARQLPIEMIERGLEILILLDRRLYATVDQVQTIFEHRPTKTGKERKPKGAENACNRACRQLYDSGFIDRVWVLLPRDRFDHYRENFVQVLTPKGLREVRLHYEQEGEGRTTRWESAKHRPEELRPFVHPYAVADFWFTLRRELSGPRFFFGEWLDDKELASRRAQGFHFQSVPDGFFLAEDAETGKVTPHFVELDCGKTTIRSYDSQKDWIDKIRDYGAYLERGGWYWSDFDGLAAPVVLIVTWNDERERHILEAIEEAGGGGSYWITTFDRLREYGLLGRIWRVWTSHEMRTLATRFS